MLRGNYTSLIGWKWSRDIYQLIRMLKIQRSVNLGWKYFYKIGARVKTEAGQWVDSSG